MHFLLSLGIIAIVPRAACTNFFFETIQLQDEDVDAFPAIAFGNQSTVSATYNGPDCKAFPGSTDWPSEEEWSRLNSSLGGVLLKPIPPGAVCYNNTAVYNPAQCLNLLFAGFTSRFYIDDPLTVLTSWTQGDTCDVTFFPQGECTQGGFPTYVINATTVKHVQAGVNFARNNNIRLVIKNTGHDFNGRSTGAGALSIWTHNLKSFEFLPEHTQSEYSGKAARVASGLEAWEMYAYMNQHNMTLVVPGGSTVGAYGGWMAGGGHSTLGSLYGLGSDQALSLQVVTADGRFVTADPETNTDLYYALRGGGPGTYGIVTSAVVKAYPPILVTSTPLSFTVGSASPFPGGNFTWPGNITWPGNGTFPGNLTIPPIQPVVTIQDVEVFWRGFNLYNYFGKDVVDANGTAYSYVSPLGNNSFSFTTTFEFPGMTNAEVKAFVQPLFTALNKMGIPVENAEPTVSQSWGPGSQQGEGDSPGSSRFASRLFPRRNWEDGALYDRTMRAIRASVEAGYTFHGIHVAPTAERAGSPGRENGVNPAWRSGVMHADLFDYQSVQGMSAALVEQAHARLNDAMSGWRDATPGAGAYVNEADLQEPDWQRSFWGDKYEGLLGIKRRWDPWGLFWAPTTVGSEGWAVRTADGLPNQNGRLCRDLSM